MHWWQSKTIWGGIIAMVGGIAGIAGVVIPQGDDVAEIAVEVSGGVAAIFGGVSAIYGRLKATKSIVKR